MIILYSATIWQAYRKAFLFLIDGNENTRTSRREVYSQLQSIALVCTAVS